VERLIVTQVFSCTCDVKTPDIQFHSLDCRYRTLAEAASTITALRAALEPFAEAASHYDEIPGVCLTHGNVELWQQPTRIRDTRLEVDHLRAARKAYEDSK
jgi:hypothetical protein